MKLRPCYKLMVKQMLWVNLWKRLNISFQNELKDGKTLYTDTINAEKREELRQWYFHRINRYNKIWYFNKQFYYTLFLSLSDKKVHILKAFNNNHKIIANKKFLRHCDHIGEEIKRNRHIYGKGHVYRLRSTVLNYNLTIYDICRKKITNANPYQIDDVQISFPDAFENINELLKPSMDI